MSQISSGVLGLSMVTAPDICLADHFEIASEMKAPPKPITAAKIKRLLRLSPFALRKGSTPSNRIVIERTKTIARFVTRK